jgi:hypothetical protein
MGLMSAGITQRFREVPKQPPSSLYNGYDEVAAKRIEGKLVELGEKFAELHPLISYLQGALDEGTSLNLLERMEDELRLTESSMSRLMCEARKQMRPE